MEPVVFRRSTAATQATLYGGFPDEPDRQLSPKAVRTDEIASTAATMVRRFDGFLAAHDAPAAGRLPDGFRVVLVAGHPVASGAADFIELGSHPGTLLQHTARSAEAVGHELTHTTHERLGIPISHASSEGWADIVGTAFARSIRAPGSNNWRLAEGVYADRPNGIRDLAKPAVPTVGALRDYLAKHADDLDEHLTAGPLTRAATLVAEATSPEKMGSIFTSALLHDLGPRAQDARGRRMPSAGIEMYLGELRTGARATLDAAARLHGTTSPEFTAVQQAWESVGLTGVDWAPRTEQ